MNIYRTMEGSELTLALEGRLDTLTARQLEDEIDLGLDGVVRLNMDLSGLDYISSAGLRSLLKAHKVMLHRGGMKVTGVSPTVMDIMELTGFTDVLNIE